MTLVNNFENKIVTWLTEMRYLFEEQEIKEKGSGYKIIGQGKALELYIGFIDNQKDLCTIQNWIDLHSKLKQQIGKLKPLDKQQYINKLRYYAFSHSPAAIKMHFDKNNIPSKIEIIGSLYEDGTTKTVLEHMLVSVRQASLSIFHYLQYISFKI